MINYPLKFHPILKEKIWGGNKLKEILNKKTTQKNIGESWEISSVKDNTSIVENGPLKGKALSDLIEEYQHDLVGKKNFEVFGTSFPLLIKFIDANKDLSVQLHPHDEVARERHDSFGKNEMWYVVQADEGSKINIGFSKNISKSEYLQCLEAGKIVSLLNFEEVKKGDSFFIKTGKVHAIGSGVLLAEIQQTSDITYRIYDWDRTDAEGNSRELHTDLALNVIDLERKEDFRMLVDRRLNETSNIVSCKYFTTNFILIKGHMVKDYSRLDSFVIYMCVGGEAVISIEGNTETIAMGQSFLIPAKNMEVEITSERVELLEIFVD
jgi:mannose-6-phosphate isomerase